MTRQSVLLLFAVIAVAPLAPVAGAQSATQRTRALAALPDWTGIWETEAAARLLISGSRDFEAPKLWGKPPYNSAWEKKLTPAHPPGPAQAGAPALPPTTKACAPTGFPAIMEFPVPDFLFELLVTPEETLLLATDGAARHIYTDGRPHPDSEDLWPTLLGDSTGHWEGQTLVIDTIARKRGPVGPVPGAADLSDQAHFTERLQRIGADRMQDDMTIDDPARFAHPWRISIHYQRVRDISRMVAVNCAENDRNPVVDGRIVIAPP